MSPLGVPAANADGSADVVERTCNRRDHVMAEPSPEPTEEVGLIGGGARIHGLEVGPGSLLDKAVADGDVAAGRTVDSSRGLDGRGRGAWEKILDAGVVGRDIRDCSGDLIRRLRWEIQLGQGHRSGDRIPPLEKRGNTISHGPHQDRDRDRDFEFNLILVAIIRD